MTKNTIPNYLSHKEGGVVSLSAQAKLEKIMSFSIRKWGKTIICLLLAAVMLFSFAEAFANPMLGDGSGYSGVGALDKKTNGGYTQAKQQNKNNNNNSNNSNKNNNNNSNNSSSSSSSSSGSSSSSTKTYGPSDSGAYWNSGTTAGKKNEANVVTVTQTKTTDGNGNSKTDYTITSTNYGTGNVVSETSGQRRENNTGIGTMINGNYTTKEYDANGNLIAETVGGNTQIDYSISTVYENYNSKYVNKKTFDASGNVTSSSRNMVLQSETIPPDNPNLTQGGGNNGYLFALTIKNNADGTKEETSSRSVYDGATNITTTSDVIKQTRADGTTIESEFKNNWEGDILNLVGKNGASTDRTKTLLGDIVGYGPNGEEIRDVLGKTEEGQMLPFGTSPETFKGTKTTYIDYGLNGEKTYVTVFTDRNGESVTYEMKYAADGTLLSQETYFKEDDSAEEQRVYNSETWITGESEARGYESMLGNDGIDFGKITLGSESGGSSGSEEGTLAPVRRIDDPVDPVSPSGPSGYSAEYSITANVKSPAGTISLADTSKGVAVYGSSKTWTFDGKSLQTISIVPDAGYIIKDVQINGISQGAVSLISVLSSESGTLVNVWFERISHKITATCGKNGIISPSGLIKVYDGESQTFTFTPDKNCSVAFVVVDGKMIEVTGNQYTFENVKEDHNIHVEFSDSNSTHFKFIYATSGEGGSLSIEGCIPVNPGETQDIEIIPDEGFEVDKIIVDGEVREAATHFRFEAVTTNHTIHVIFKEKAARTSFVVTATAGAGGTISPNGMTTVASGGSMTLNITPDDGYIVGNVYVNGRSAGMMGELTLTNIFDDQTVYATFINTSSYGADLAIADITPDKAYAGMKAMSFVRVMNLGTVAARNTEVKFTVNGQTYTETIAEDIYPGSYYDVLFKWPAPLTAGTVSAQAQVNGNNAVQETNTANNSFTKDISVAAMYPEARDDEDAGIINPEAYSVPSDNPVADVIWEQNGEMYRALVGIQVDPSANGLKSGYGFETTAIVQIVTNSPDLSVEDLKVIARLPEFGYSKCKVLEEDTSKRTETTEEGVRTITCTYRFAVNTTSKIGARKWYIPVSWPDMYNYKMHTQVYGIATPAGYIEVSQNSSILINSNMYTDDSLSRG